MAGSGGSSLSEQEKMIAATNSKMQINNTYSYKIQAVYPKGVKSLASQEIKIIY